MERVIYTHGTITVSRQLLVGLDCQRQDYEMYDDLLTMAERQAAAEGRPLVKL